MNARILIALATSTLVLAHTAGAVTPGNGSTPPRGDAAAGSGASREDGPRPAADQPAAADSRPAAPEAILDVSRMEASALEALARGPIPAGTTLLVPAGYRLPVQMKVSGDTVFTPDAEASVGLEARRDVYLRFDGSTVMVSLDGHHWLAPTELFGGSLSFGLSGEPGGHAVKGTFELELRTRDTGSR